MALVSPWIWKVPVWFKVNSGCWLAFLSTAFLLSGQGLRKLAGHRHKVATFGSTILPSVGAKRRVPTRGLQHRPPLYSVSHPTPYMLNQDDPNSVKGKYIVSWFGCERETKRNHNNNGHKTQLIEIIILVPLLSPIYNLYNIYICIIKQSYKWN